MPTNGCNAITCEGRCITYFTSSGVNWIDARADCISRGYDLVTISSYKENALVFGTALLAYGWNAYCWIGINDIDNEGTFVWADGSGSKYRQWVSGQPHDSSGNEDCGIFSANPNWRDSPCQETRNCHFCGTTGKI